MGGNLKIYDRQADVVPFYNSASLLINLTNPRQAVETFGMTPLEAMSDGLPVIVPTIGGIAEMVDEGVNGYKTDVQDLDIIRKQICLILENKTAYLYLANKALSYAAKYDSAKVIDRMIYSLENEN